jgi:hypothetical protein
MSRRRIFKGLLFLALGAAAFTVLGMYYLVRADAFKMPNVYRWDLPVATGGTITLHRVDNNPEWDGMQILEAVYRPLRTEDRTEPVGRWSGHVYRPKAYATGKCVIFVPAGDALFIRTDYGHWKSFSMPTLEQWDEGSIARADRDRIRSASHVRNADGVARYMVRAVLPDERLFILDASTYWPELHARIFLRLSETCEQFTLERTQP